MGKLQFTPQKLVAIFNSMTSKILIFAIHLPKVLIFFNSGTPSIKVAMTDRTVITCNAHVHCSLFTAQNTPITITTPTQPNPRLTHLTHVQPNHCTLQFTLNITKQVKRKTQELKKAINDRQSHDKGEPILSTTYVTTTHKPPKV